MEDKGIPRALTNDHRFEQEGFTVLMDCRDEFLTEVEYGGVWRQSTRHEPPQHRLPALP